MKKNPFLLIFLLSFLSIPRIYSQNLDLFNPSNEIYLFSAYDEGANAFRNNPAVLGLKHKLNGTINLFLRNNSFDKKLELSEFDAMINTGILGLSYRRGIISEFYYGTDPVTNYLNTFSLGLGFGNKTISGGLIGEWLFNDYNNNIQSQIYVIPNDYQFNNLRFGFGVLYRPSEFFSSAFTFKNGESFDINSTLSDKYNLGVAIRPLSNNLISLMMDFGFTPITNRGFFEDNMLKVGLALNTKFGFDINANLTRFNNSRINDYFNIGFTYNFPNTSLHYSNVFYKFSDRSNSPSTYKSVGSMISLGFNLERKNSAVTEPKRILEITLSGELQDYTTEDVFLGILGNGKRSIHEVIADIDNASVDPAIKGILMKVYPISNSRIVGIDAKIEEITGAMERFKSHGKNIIVYFPQDVTATEYYIGTFANDIVLPGEAILFCGLSTDIINYKQFLQKYGIELQTFHAGKYKLTYQGLLDSTSSEGKEVINRVLDIVYDKMLHAVRYGRNIIIDDNIKNKLSQPISAVEAKQLGLIDVIGWYEDAKKLSEKNSGTKDITRNYNSKVWDTGWGEPDALAIIGVYSSITPGKSEAPDPIQIPFLSKGRSTGSETVVRQLEEAFANPRVKAIILRVDSGGGSALASAEINDALIRLRKKYKKPLIVSMGWAAASGGYYVSANADKIFCDELTITGSIGVFTAIPNLDSLIQNQHIKVENFKRGDYSDIGSIYKKLDSSEIRIIQNLINYYYDRFVETVSKGRNLSKEEAEQVAQGRVWLGTDAYSKKLVDEIGGLYEAIKYAKQQGNIGKRMKIEYYEVPGGERINDLVTASIVQYLQKNFLNLLGFDDDNPGIDIKY